MFIHGLGRLDLIHLFWLRKLQYVHRILLILINMSEFLQLSHLKPQLESAGQQREKYGGSVYGSKFTQRDRCYYLFTDFRWRRHGNSEPDGGDDVVSGAGDGRDEASENIGQWRQRTDHRRTAWSADTSQTVTRLVRSLRIQYNTIGLLVVFVITIITLHYRFALKN